MYDLLDLSIEDLRFFSGRLVQYEAINIRVLPWPGYCLSLLLYAD